MHPVIETVTDRIRTRSRASREAYLQRIAQAGQNGPQREALGCSNLAHGVAACGEPDKQRLIGERVPNIGIVTAYNDMLSAHQPYESYPQQIRDAAAEFGAVAQVAGGVPAMCDGITQGRDAMDLSLFSRDVIAMGTAIALSHDMFDAVLCLGICDKIVPGLLIGSLSFGHLPTVFVPAGPMPSGISNQEKARIREAFAAGTVGRDALLAAEAGAYHAPGTCTFYGTANGNQMLMEFLGLQLPGSSFVAPSTPLRTQLTRAAVGQALRITAEQEQYTPIGHIVSEAAIVNAIIGLLATGGSTNHTIHLVAIAAAAGIRIDWSDFAELSTAVPLVAQVYPNGSADVNHFHAAGGLGFIIRHFLEQGLLHDDVDTILGRGLHRFAREAVLEDGAVNWRAAPEIPRDSEVLRPPLSPFQKEGGLRLVQGTLGRAIVKVSSVAPEYRKITAPARVFPSQQALHDAFEAAELQGDLVAVVPFQGPQAIGMPELHKLTPYLGVLQNRGQRVALLTDGRMSGASGKVLAAIQVTPEAAAGGDISRIRDGDMITIDADAGELSVAAPLAEREPVASEHPQHAAGSGRELFAVFRQRVGPADRGASPLLAGED